MGYPIVIFSYNRPRHVQLTIESLAKNPLARESDLYICSDAPRTKADLALVMRCRRYFEQVQGFRSVEVMKFTENHNVKRAAKFMGDWMSQRHEAWISIEDDIIVHEDFLQFMNQALDAYREHPEVACVLGYAYDSIFEKVLLERNYQHDVLFTQAFYAFGWGTWANKWQSLDISMPEKNYFQGMGSYLEILRRSWSHLASHRVASKATSELWDVHFCYEMIRRNLVAVMPVRGYLQNIGYDGSGLHQYHFDSVFFQEVLQPKESINFIQDTHVSEPFHTAITLRVIGLWLRAFRGNLWLLIQSRLKGRVKQEEVLLAEG
ncbi:hypothetical protein PVA45_02390 [Entomospira entomophila]|uniref:Glycosyltransferase 2-like domain-containing protein n=1 Tax=Entomospira entomophila TaxID=2719988 RepID=A0A968GBK0_9SPIO|nr:hypothetical protein [Entomospira entomophilus]NIZ40361.1 hypothetical protein [Entomospira entomophilus]WDI35920.1 hypothetical protein PVA45_02390 [Entomospira entomophilus]